MIHAIKRAFTHYVPVIIGPAPYFGVEFINQIGGRLAQRCFDGFSDARQEAFDVFLGGLNEQFPIGSICARFVRESRSLASPA